MLFDSRYLWIFVGSGVEVLTWYMYDSQWLSVNATMFSVTANPALIVWVRQWCPMFITVINFLCRAISWLEIELLVINYTALYFILLWKIISSKHIFPQSIQPYFSNRFSMFFSRSFFFFHYLEARIRLAIFDGFQFLCYHLWWFQRSMLRMGLIESHQLFVWGTMSGLHLILQPWHLEVSQQHSEVHLDCCSSPSVPLLTSHTCHLQ